MAGISKSQVSRLCVEIDEKRPIEGDWPYLWIDATREGTRERAPRLQIIATASIGVGERGDHLDHDTLARGRPGRPAAGRGRRRRSARVYGDLGAPSGLPRSRG